MRIVRTVLVGNVTFIEPVQRKFLGFVGGELPELLV
jgi:hypothetical protein